MNVHGNDVHGNDVHGNDEARRCALPRCDAVIPAAPGRSERRYCTPAHRVAARQARRAAMQAHRAAAVAAILPWLRGGGPDPDRYGAELARIVGGTPAARAGVPATPGAVARAAARRSRRHDRSRRRTVTVVGVAGLLAGGYARTARPEPPAPPAPVQATPGTGSTDEWAGRTTVVVPGRRQDAGTPREQAGGSGPPDPRGPGHGDPDVLAEQPAQVRRVAAEARRATTGQGDHVARPTPPRADMNPAEGSTVGARAGRHRARPERPERSPVTATDDPDDEEIEERNAAVSRDSQHVGGPDDYIRFSRSLVGA